MDRLIREDQSEDHSMIRTRINWYFLCSLLAFGASAAAWVALARWVLR
jgi:hypothetical protein